MIMSQKLGIKSKRNELIESVIILSLILAALFLSLSDPYRMIPGASQMNFFIHEFGHLVAMTIPPFSSYPLLIAIAGTFFQLLVPTAFTIYFFIQSRVLEGAIFLCWLGTNLVYVGVYMKDAIYKTMPMADVFGPDAIHDWEYIFREMGVILQAVEIGNFVIYLGWGVMILSGVVVGWRGVNISIRG